MKQKLLLSAMAALFFLAADAQLKTPAPSPTQTIKQDLGISSVELSYSRPGVKGRKVFGDLVPFGKVWRTGANNATIITFGDEVTIGGKKIPAGKYGLLSIPDKKDWTLIITRQLDVTSPAAYKEDQDVARVTVEAMKTDADVETLTMQFTNIKSNACMLQISWEKTMVNLPIITEVDSKIMAQIDQVMNKDTRPYYASAMYYMENGKDLNQALAWFDKAAEQQPTAYWVLHQRANCLAKLGKKEEAKACAEKSKAMAIDQKNDDYVKLNEKLLAELNK